MILETGKYYHLYNRSNNDELVFKDERNYYFFLERYRLLVGEFVSTLAYCLMPTHFHFVVKITTDDCVSLKKSIATLLSCYIKAINREYTRHGSLFQPRSKAKEVDDEKYLLTLITYVHQNPVRAKLVKGLSDWKYSSYAELVGIRDGTLADKNFVQRYFSTLEGFRKYSEELIIDVRRKYWV